MRNFSIIKTTGVFLLLTGLIFLTHSSCVKDEKIDLTKYGNCTDKIRNQNETGVDCGGYCGPCQSCSDGIQNQGETGIDCGGPCQSCTPNCTVTASSMDYTIYVQPGNPSTSNAQTYGSAYYYTSQSQISIGFQSSILTSMVIQFIDNFNPLASMSLNQSRAFTTVANSSDIQNNSNVLVTYRYNSFYSSTSVGGVVDAGQKVYIAKTGSSNGLITLCNVSAGSTTYGQDNLSLSVPLN